MRFGVFVPQGWRLDLVGVEPGNQWQVMRDFARRADELGFESAWVYDHFHTVPEPTQQATHEAWSLMAALAASTERIRLGQMCTCMGYRNPTYLAKVAATCDVISGGRVEMGIGGGWYEHEWRAYGYGFPSAGERLGMLDEGVQIMRQAWTTGSATLAGKHYQVDGAIVRPLPIQDGGPPLWIAGSGERKTLRTAAKYAQYTNFDASTPEHFTHKSEVLEQHCRDVGRDFGEIVRSANFNVVIGETEQDVQDKLAWVLDHYRPLVAEKQAERQHQLVSGGLVGTPEQLAERLREAQKLGMTYAIGYFVGATYDPSSVELFATKVIPELQ